MSILELTHAELQEVKYAVTFVYGGHKETNTRNPRLEKLAAKLVNASFGRFDRSDLTEVVACCAFCFGGWNYPTPRPMPHLEAAIEKMKSLLQTSAHDLGETLFGSATVTP